MKMSDASANALAKELLAIIDKRAVNREQVLEKIIEQSRFQKEVPMLLRVWDQKI